MSPTNNTEENWILFQSRYDYIALPVDVGVEVLKHMKVVTKNGRNLELVTGEVNVLMVSSEQMTVAQVKAKLLPEDKEK